MHALTREEISSWKSFPSVSILIPGKCCASENSGVVCPRVEPKYCCDFVKWRACGTRAWSREIRSRRTTILKDAASCRPYSLHPRKPTADGENSHHCNHPRSIQSHWSRRLRSWDTTPPTDPNHC